MATTQQQDDDEEEINPMKMLFTDDDFDLEYHLPNAQGAAETQQHFILSLNSTVVIRQIRSEGLSFQLWPAATTLFNLLDSHHHTDNPLSEILSRPDTKKRLKILELGSGTGLVGIAAAVIIGADVIVTDLPHVIPNLQFNIDANVDLFRRREGSIRAEALSWGVESDVERIGRNFDVVVASDVVYHVHLYEPLLETLRLLLLGGKEDIVFVMAHLRRWKKESAFFNKAKKLFQVKTVHTDPPTQGSRIGVAVYIFAAKHIYQRQKRV